MRSFCHLTLPVTIKALKKAHSESKAQNREVLRVYQSLSNTPGLCENVIMDGSYQALQWTELQDFVEDVHTSEFLIWKLRTPTSFK